jgi:2-polyprenyl-3-methyl-5-hydroxy-6-metoxy-1,4-benzoquinol methylase
MQLISEEYRKLNEQLHETNKHYGTSGQLYVSDIIGILKNLQTQDVLDYGCGKSTLAQNLPFSIKQYDPAVPKYAAQPDPADLVVCTDVLEHIEPEMIDDVLKHLAKLTKKAGYFTACTVAAQKTLADGRNAHLIVKPPIWWIHKIDEHFEILNFTKKGHEAVFIVQPKGIK